MARSPRRTRRLAHETAVTLLALAGGAPPLAIALVVIQRAIDDPVLRAGLQVALAGLWVGCAFAVRGRVVRPLQSIANMVAAIREGDTSLRARGADPESALGLAYFEVNALTTEVGRQRLGVLEATALLRSVMDSIDVAVFAFDAERRLRLVNQEGERLIGLPAERALGRGADALGLAPALDGETPRLLELSLAGRGGRWELRRGAWRQQGRPHEIVFLADVSRALRAEERQAFERLVRVLSHEINNSLAPIQSIAGSLRALLGRGREAERGEDLAGGLAVIESRARSLGRFMQEYARLARLPSPRPGPVDVGAWVRRVAALETRLEVGVRPGPPVTLSADGDQLDQLLINLVRNAADAALEAGGAAWLAWQAADGWLVLTVEDEGPGLADTDNLFVPFFTTKEGGTGIGLALSRQIAEAHGGTLALANRGPDAAGRPRRGCVATIRLPLPAA